MIVKFSEDYRIKRAKDKFENRNKSNQRIAIYQRNKLLGVSKLIRDRFRQDSDFSIDEYFEVLVKSRVHQGKIVRKCGLDNKNDTDIIRHSKEGADGVRAKISRSNEGRVR